MSSPVSRLCKSLATGRDKPVPYGFCSLRVGAPEPRVETLHDRLTGTEVVRV